MKRFLVPNYPPAIFSVQENQASEKKRSLLHFPKSSLRLQIGINTVHASCSFSPSYRQTDLKASHALFPLSEMKAVQIGDFVCGGGAIGERGVCLCFPRYRCNSWASGKKKERQKKKKSVPKGTQLHSSTRSCTTLPDKGIIQFWTVSGPTTHGSQSLIFLKHRLDIIGYYWILLF